MGADMINSARGFAFALGCIQALKCHTNHCPTGITTHNPYLERALDPTDKAVRVENYVKNVVKETLDICHSCGLSEPQNFKRIHARIVTANGQSKLMSDLYPDKIPF
jgi:glutamate synthase domain-containing protein 2